MNREDIIAMAKEVGFSDGEIDTCQLMLERFAVLVAQQEREACAKLCEEGIANADDWNSDHWDQACENRAWAIRARKSGYE